VYLGYVDDGVCVCVCVYIYIYHIILYFGNISLKEAHKYSIFVISGSLLNIAQLLAPIKLNTEQRAGKLS
jgi:hypothetical protein